MFLFVDFDVCIIKYLEKQFEAGDMTRQEAVSNNSGPSSFWRKQKVLTKIFFNPRREHSKMNQFVFIGNLSEMR
jgi:hypothetical protein